MEKTISMGNMTKMIAYSYPTSLNATRFGFKATGCYTVELADGRRPAVAVSGHATVEEAREALQALPYPVDQYSL